MNRKYYYELLNNYGKQIYDEILYDLKKRYQETDIDMSILTDSNKDVHHILRYIKNDNPQLFYVDFTNIKLEYNNVEMKIKFNFLCSLQLIEKYETKINKQIKNILNLQEIKKSKNTYEKELALFSYLACNISYNFANQSDVAAHTVFGALCNHSAVCEGYAKAFLLICNYLNIECLLVEGQAINNYGIKKNHAWNIVKVDDDYCHIDVTWGSTLGEKNTPSFNYVNLTDREISANHFWDISETPKCNSTQFFPINTLKDEKEFEEYLISQIRRGGKVFTVRVKKKFHSNNAVMKLVKNIISQNSKMLGIYSCDIQTSYDKKMKIINVILNY